MIKWLFFDVGGTILDDEPVYRFQEQVILELLNSHGCQVTKKEFESAVRAARRHYLPRYVNHLIWIFTEDVDLYEKVSLEFEETVNTMGYEDYRRYLRYLPGMKELLLDVSQRYSLGVVGNQPAVVRELLEEDGLMRILSLQAISSEMGLRKPDLRFFMGALAMAGCSADQVAMIGDRLDNDVYPARTVGMTTVRLKTGPHRHQPVLSPEYLPHYTVSSTRALSDLLTSEKFVAKTQGAEMVW